MQTIRVRVALCIASVLLLSVIASAQSDSIKLLTRDTGWALISHQLFWTTNDGTDWKEITPPAVQPGHAAIASVFFLDTSNGWAALGPRDPTAPNARFDLASTNDGGTTWSIAPVKIPDWNPNAEILGGGAAIDFVDPMDGWLSLSLESSAAFNRGLLLSTADGGRTWQRVPGAPMIFAQVRFVTSADGWLAGGPGGGALYATHDGGLTWEEVTLKAPPGPGRAVYPKYFLPVFRDASQGYLPVDFFYLDRDWAGTALVLFATEDGGRSWKAAGVLRDSKPISSGAVVPVTVAGSMLLTAAISHWTSLALTRLGRDGRAETASGSIPHPAAAAGQLSFLDAEHGWVFAGRIYATSDGGATWRDIGPFPYRGWLGIPGAKPPATPPAPSAPAGGGPSASLVTAVPSGGGTGGGLQRVKRHPGIGD